MLEEDTPVPVFSQDREACNRFSKWFEDPQNREVERTPIREGLLVVTSFLGINRARHPDKELVLWETQVFKEGVAGSSHLCSSAQAARTAHWELVWCVLRKECLPIPPELREAILRHVPAAFRADYPFPSLPTSLGEVSLPNPQVRPLRGNPVKS